MGQITDISESEIGDLLGEIVFVREASEEVLLCLLRLLGSHSFQAITKYKKIAFLKIFFYLIFELKVRTFF